MEMGRFQSVELSELREETEQLENVRRCGAGFGGTTGGTLFGAASSIISTSSGFIDIELYELT